jgi:hypothetical protein
MSELHVSQAFYEHQARPNPTLFEPVVKVFWERVLSPKVLRVFFIKTASKQPLFKAR